MNASTSRPPVSSSKQVGADVAILLITVLWGLAYVVVKDAIGRVDYFVYLNQRFVLSFVLTLPFFWFRRKKINARTVRHGIVLGFFLFASYTVLTIGLQYTTATVSAFIVNLHVLFVPLIEALLFREPMSGGAKLGGLFCLGGLFLLCTRGTCSFDALHPGALWVLLGAAFIGMRIIYTSRCVRESDVYSLTGVQLGTVAVLTIPGVLAHGQPLIAYHPQIAWQLAFLAILATVLCFMVVNAMQRFTTSTHVAVVFCMEPVFTGIFGFLIADEILPPLALLGAGLVLCGMILTEIPMNVLRDRIVRRILPKHRLTPGAR